eukprot:Gregarina_sp_Poly_1__5021@NODE_2661_length_1858_cov_27_162479_g1687_i0_p2_GENE_NODE_2661_length_1858_cov_27_162479_g1687_i0NODE_2661_length_1858_cov_27_162479_g1687_i0_p2_ORF_typecomplete_len216_score14_94MscL/PF01741_18/1_5e27DUF2614/PF11023_8/0_092_NODE_2661_length_1858_cov_27_162479_g1687_i011301777
MVCCSGFRDFVLRGNVIDIAVGIVIGAAFKDVVDSLVADLITPLIGIFKNIPDFTGAVFIVHGSEFRYGRFVNFVLSFLLLAFIVYVCVVIPANRLTRMVVSSKPDEPCPHCQMACPYRATVCGHCTRAIPRPPKLSSPVEIREATQRDFDSLSAEAGDSYIMDPRKLSPHEMFGGKEIVLTKEDREILSKKDSSLRPVDPPIRSAMFARASRSK